MLTLVTNYDVIVFTGDLNSLKCDDLMESLGLTQIVDKPTRANRTLDVLYTNRPDLFSVTVARSLVKSDHLAVFVNCCKDDSTDKTNCATPKKKCKCYNRDNASVSRLTCFFNEYSWNALIISIDNDVISVDDAFADFLNVLQFAIDNVVGYCVVTLRNHEPPYITPHIKLLLKKRNRLMRRGRTVEADTLSLNIGERIAKARSRLLSKATLKDTKQLWSLIKKSNPSPSALTANTETNLTADDLNRHFAKIATDCDYNEDAINSLFDSVNADSTDQQFVPYTSDLFAIILSKLQRTSPGPDGVPYWLYKTCSTQLSLIMSKLVNFSIAKGIVPNAWRTAHITPIPKISPVTGPADFRPISVTPIFARITEKLIVRDFLHPYILPDLFKDQYAFKPTGSTTCALIDLTYRVQMMLEQCRYVRCVFVDFSKAFNTRYYAF